MRSRRRLDQEEVLAAAVAIALEQGLPMVSRPSVAERLEVKEKAVAALWPDADALVATTFSRIVGDELAEAQREALAQTSPVAQLGVLIEALAEPVAHLDAAWAEAWSVGRRNPALGAVVRSEESAWQGLIAAVIRSGVQSGDFAEVDPDEVATHLLAAIDGVNVYSLVGYHSDIDRLRMLRAVARTHLGPAVALDGDPAAGQDVSR